MKRLGPVALLVGALITAAPLSFAQEQSTVFSPVLTVDQERLFSGSRVAERVSAEIERRTQELAAENRQIEADLTAQELELTELRATLDPTEFRSLANAFDVKVQAIRVTQDEKARVLQRLQEEEQQNFLRRISPVLAEIVRERRALVVLDRRAVFLSADSIDITDEAIERINASLDIDIDVMPELSEETLPLVMPEEDPQLVPPAPAEIAPSSEAPEGPQQP